MRIARIDPADEGIDGIVEEAPAESAHDKLCDRFVGLSTFPTEGFAEDAKLIPEGEERSP